MFWIGKSESGATSIQLTASGGITKLMRWILLALGEMRAGVRARGLALARCLLGHLVFEGLEVEPSLSQED
jgi:hypothetical protein